MDSICPEKSYTFLSQILYRMKNILLNTSAMDAVQKNHKDTLLEWVLNQK
jgi:hypothetical protein